MLALFFAVYKISRASQVAKRICLQCRRPGFDP